MKIAALRFHNVKRFARQGMAIEGMGEGVNVLCAPNEHGKSTSFEALHALFFQPHTGKPREVMRLQPYSGGNPLVQADIATAEGRFRLTKQFINGRRATVEDLASGRLLAQADEAERFIAGLIRGGTAGPAGLLWVRQGLTGLEDKRKEDESERQVRESLLTSVQGEVEAVTGGRRMSAIIAACQEEVARLVTATGRPRTGGPYMAVLEEKTRLEAEEQRLAADVATLRAALDERAQLHRRLKELADPMEAAARREAVERAGAALEEARRHASALESAQAIAALARSRADAAARDLASFREALAQRDALTSEAAATGQKRADALASKAQAERETQAATLEVQAAEAEERATRDLLARLDAALAARRAFEEREGLRERLQRAEALRAAIEQEEAALALIAIPADKIEALQELEIDIARRRAADAAGLPSLSIAYQPGAAPVLIEGAPLPAGTEHPVRERVELALPGIGTLTLRANRAAPSDAGLPAAERRHAGLLAALGVSSLTEARQRLEAARAAAAGLDQHRLELRLVAPEGLAKLREEVARREAVAPEMLELKADPEATRAALAQADRRVSMARAALHELQPVQRRALEAVSATDTAAATLARELERVEARLGPAPTRAEREAALAGEQATREAEAVRLEAHAAALRAAAPDLASAEAALRRATSAQEAARQEEALTERRLGELNGQIRTRADDAVEEKWQETLEALKATTARAAAFEQEVAALGRLAGALQGARSAARDLYLKPVIAELRPLLGLLFDDVSIVFDEKTLLPQSLRRNGQDEEIDRLSGGMREQLSVLTRLAFARLLAQDGRPAPVILDDALVYSDDDRIERMFDALHRQAREQQIIVFSCRQRAFARLGGTVLRMAPWEPPAA